MAADGRRPAAEQPYRGQTSVTAVVLSIEPLMAGPLSVGTVEVIRLLRVHAHLGLAEAKHLVDRCVFDGESVRIPTPSPSDAAALAAALADLPESPRIRVLISD